MPFIAKEHHLQAHSRKHEGLNHCRDAQPAILDSVRGQEKSKAARIDVGKIIRVINAAVHVAPHQQHSGFLLWGLFLAVGRSWCPCETPSAQLRGNSAAMGNEFPDKHPLNFGTHVHKSWPRRIQLSVGN